ncbi:DUF2849 domain-containing protein [Alisedimentitalea sp. MJ-SS2]|uniref:DUF2849 domain-containing protein n=1 Tax=Aliisedimentitalea sp. MJ-SS2 TaxID=3049795 RepID=UPI00291533B9|nr:DUF2849 domain-containing protein [Alisedimentitalea sp. MJ-SS2]MDU8926703.1 DUF2849 domain-containing protein [Alisedimentitalea sp. MJ-SS2]
MSTQPNFHVVTANALDTGDVVYLTGCDEWSPEILTAEFIDDTEHADFRLFVAQGQTRLVVDAHLAEVEITDNGPVPLTRREALRAQGPSVAAPQPHAIAAE